MQDRFNYRFWDKKNNLMIYPSEQLSDEEYTKLEKIYLRDEWYIIPEITLTDSLNYFDNRPFVIMQCTGLRDKNGKLIYEGDIIVIPNQYPFYDYKNKEDMKQDLNSTKGEIKGESILNYIGIVEWIYSQWQYVYHCVNPKKQGISEGVNQGLNDFGFDETKNTCYEVIGNIYENPELLERGE